MKKLLLALSFVALCAFGYAETTLPAPTQRFNDHAKLVSPEVATRIEAQLAELEKSDSTQFVVYIYPTLDTESSMEDYTQRTAQKWGIGQKGNNNGLVLFLFAKDSDGYKRIRFETGYGLEGAFPDAKSKLIIEREIVPALKQGKWDEAVTLGTSAAIAEIKGEYKASNAPKKGYGMIFYLCVGGFSIWLLFLIFSPRATLSMTVDILEILVSSKGGKSSGGSSWGGGGGSFGGGGSSGRA